MKYDSSSLLEAQIHLHLAELVLQLSQLPLQQHFLVLHVSNELDELVILTSLLLNMLLSEFFILYILD